MTLPERSGAKRVAVPALIAIAIAGTVTHAALAAAGLGHSAIVSDWLYDATLAAAALAILCRAAWVARDRAAWIALGAGVASWTLGEIYWSVAYAGQTHVPVPSGADVFYLASYPLYYIGVGLLIRTRVTRFGASLWLDGAICALATAGLASALLEPAFGGLTNGHTAEVATNFAYPVFDVTMLAILAGAVTVSSGRQTRDLLLIGSGMLVTAVADAIFLYQDAVGSYVEGSLLDSLWLVGGLLIAFAAWARTRPEPIRLEGYERVALPAAFAVVAIGVLVTDRGEGSEAGFLLSVATLLLVVIRLVLAFGENARLLRSVSHEAITDALTGLGNRRSLMADLDGSFAALEPGDQRTFALLDLDGFKAYNDTYGHAAGDLLLKRMGHHLSAAVSPFGCAYRLGGDEFCIIANPGAQPRAVIAAASAALSEEGEGFTITASSGSVTIPLEAAAPSEALRLADRRMYAEKGRRGGSAERQTQSVLMSILREREPSLGVHLEGVGKLALALGRVLGLHAEDLDVLGRAAELHDIGKVAIPDAILHKSGALSDDERRLVERHTVIGERVLESAAAMTPVARLVRSTHERWEGGGYPDGLSGEEIPLGARIILICDAFDAMTSARAYRPVPLSDEEALKELRRGAGSQFDPELVELFCDEVYPLADRPRTAHG